MDCASIAPQKCRFVFRKLFLRLGVVVHSSNIEPTAGLTITSHSSAAAVHLQNELRHIEALQFLDMPHDRQAQVHLHPC